MDIDALIRDEEYINKLRQEKEGNRLSSSMLFICSDTAFSRILLNFVAKLLLCDDVCETCENCSKIVAGTHPDVKTYPKNGTKLLVADSNEIVQESYIRPIFADKKIFVINSIDSSTEEAQNKLLKILEEPPENVYFIISAGNIMNVLPTIRSRCNKIEVGAIDNSKISSVFSSDRKSTLAVELGEGYLGRTQSYLDKKNLEDICNFVIEIITKLKNSKQVLTYSKKFGDFRNDFEFILKILGLCLEDLLKIKCGKSELVKLKIFLSEYESVLGEYSERAIIEISKSIPKVIEKLNFNVQPQIVFDNFLLNLLEVKYLCR